MRSLAATLFVTLTVAACGGGGSGGPLPNLPPGTSGPSDSSAASAPSTPADDAESVGEALFPGPGPLVAPAATREEVGRRANALLERYERFTTELFRQIDRVYRQLSSGLDSAEEQSILEQDVAFFETVNARCLPRFDANGSLTALFDCGLTTAQFAFRHPLYRDVSVIVDDYDATLPQVENRGSRIAIRHATRFGSTELGGGSMLIRIDRARTTTDLDRDPLALSVGRPAYLDSNPCQVYLEPTRFPEARLDVNECAERFAEALLVLERLTGL